MYFLILSFVVISLLFLLSWRDPTEKLLLPAMFAPLGQGSGHTALGAAGEFVAQSILGKRKDDQPCLTTEDCVRTGQCSGHCGWR